MLTLKNYSWCFILVALVMAGCRSMDEHYYSDGVGTAGARNVTGQSPYANYDDSDDAYDDGSGGGGGRACGAGAGNGRGGPAMPPYDRPFPLGQVTDAHTDTQQTNAEAFKFIMYDHEFREAENTAGLVNTTLTPDGKKHLTQIAVRLPQVPFPVVIEESDDPTINELRRTNVVRWLCAFHQLSDDDPRRETIQGRVVIAPAIEDGLRADEAISAGFNVMNNSYGGFGGGGYGGY